MQHPGGCKDWRQWRKTWQDIKSRTKTKKASLNRYLNGTGGGPPPPPSGKLTYVEEKVVAILCPTSITGNKDIEEPNITFTFEDKVEIKATPEVTDPQNKSELSDHENSDGDSKILEFETDQKKLAEVLPIPKKNYQATAKPRTVASNRLQKSAEATATLADLSKKRFEFDKEMAIKKLEIEKQYRDRKLQLLERQTKAIEDLAETIKNK